MADLDVLSKHSKALLDDMVADVVNVQQQLKALPTAMAQMLAEQTKQLNAIQATHVQRLTELSVTQRDSQAAVLAQGVELLNTIVNSAKQLIVDQSKKERGESFYQVKAVRDDAIADLKTELGKVDGMVADIKNSLEPALASYSEKLGKAAEATANYCNTTVAKADEQSATRMENAAASVMQRMAQSTVAQMWTFLVVGAVIWLCAGGLGAWAVVKMVAP
jgi:hypothetical protein